nr:ribonuclease H-like domain-containing protein [Tanacetum cinerariifolium]
MLVQHQAPEGEESDESLPPSPIYDRYQSGNEYHVVPPPYTGTFMPPKPDLVSNNAPNDVETNHPGFTVKLSPTKPDQDLSLTNRSSTPIIENWHAETSIPPQTSILNLTSNGKRRNRKACFVCRSLDHLIKDYDYHEKKMAQPTTRNHAHSTSPSRVTAVKALVVNVAQGMQGKWEWRPKYPILDHVSCNTSASMTLKRFDYNNALWRSKSDKEVIDSGCSRHMTRNISSLFDFEELNGGYATFGGNPKGGKISGKGKIRTGKLDFDDVYFVKELKFNIFSVSYMCDKKNSVLFTDIECLVLSPNFKLPDESQVLLRLPRENNMYNVNLKNIVPSGDLTCLFAKATIDESNI